MPQSNVDNTATEKAPLTSVQVGVAKADPQLMIKDLQTDLTKDWSGKKRGMEKGGDGDVITAAEEDMLRLMHPSIVSG